MNLNQKGLRMFFKDYQVEAFKALWSSPKEMSSKEVWEAVGEKTISRASIINFLVEMADLGFLERSEKSGKGGHRGIYTPKYDEEGMKRVLKKMFMEKLEAL